MKKINKEENRRLYVELLRGNFEKILSELELVYKLTHNGEKGKEAEEILKNFLKNYLPKKYEITTGFVHSDLGLSNQSDILLYDANNYAPLYSGYANKIIHINSLRGAIECTMKLNKKKIVDDNRKMGNIKKLYRNDVEVKNSISREPVGVLFAYKSEGKILEALNSLEEKNIDIVFSGDGYLYTLTSDGKSYTNNLVDMMHSGETQHGYVFTKQQHGFSMFFSMLIDKIDTVTIINNSEIMFGQYQKSSIYVDYK